MSGPARGVYYDHTTGTFKEWTAADEANYQKQTKPLATAVDERLPRRSQRQPATGKRPAVVIGVRG